MNVTVHRRCIEYALFYTNTYNEDMSLYWVLCIFLALARIIPHLLQAGIAGTDISFLGHYFSPGLERRA